MKNLVLFGIFVLFLVAVQFASGQTVDEIIEKHIRAKGGLDKLDAIQNIYLEGMIVLMGITSFIKIANVLDELNPKKFNLQWQITVPQNSSVTNEHFTLLSKVTEGMQIELGMAEAPLINYITKGHSVVLIGKETIEEITCYHLKLTKKEGTVIYYWINTTDFLLVQTSFKNNNSHTPVQESNCTRYNNYKTVDGISFAHAIEIQMFYLNKKNRFELNFNKIVINHSIEVNFLNQNQYNQS